MRIGIRRTGWGLALAVLCIGSMVRAQPAPPLTNLPSLDTLPAPGLPPRPVAVPLPASPPPAAGVVPGAPAVLTPMPRTTAPVTPAAPPAAGNGEHKAEQHAEKEKEKEKEHEKEEKEEKEHEHAHEEAEEPHSAIILDGEYLFWRPVRSNQDYVISGTNPQFGPIGNIKSVDGSYSSGFRVGGGYRFCSGWEVDFYFTYLQTARGADTTGPAGGALFPTITFPGQVTTVAGASAATSVNLNIYDIEFARYFHASECLDFRAFAGPRFAYIDQKFAANYNGGDVTSGVDSVRRQSQFDGFGLRAGGQANYKLWEHLSVYGRGSASLMTGSYNSSLLEVANGTTIVATSQKFQKLVPVLDMGVGLSWQWKNLRLSAGYEFVNFFGLDDQLNFADDNTPGKLARRISDLGFEGVVFRAQFVY